MKLILLLLILLSTLGCYRKSTQPATYTTQEEIQVKTKSEHSANELSNGFGFGLGFSTNKALLLDVLYKRNRSMFKLGYAHQYNGQLGSLKGSRLANYGRAIVGNSAYFIAIVGGYDFWLNKKFAIGVDGAAGSNGAYINYSDKRFKAGGYHMINTSEYVFGYGGKLNYLWTKSIMISGGYNTLTGGNLTINFAPYGGN